MGDSRGFDRNEAAREAWDEHPAADAHQIARALKPTGWAAWHRDVPRGDDASSHSIKTKTGQRKPSSTKDDTLLRAAWDRINSDHTKSDQSWKSPYYIDKSSELAPVLIQLEKAINLRREREAKKMEGTFTPFAFFDYQRDGIGMAVHLDSSVGALLLADDMGLGKTLQTLAMLRANPLSGPTFIIMPAALIPQWQADLQEVLGLNSRQLIVYDRQDGIGKEEFSKATVVITSYNKVQQQYAAMMASFNASTAHWKDPNATSYEDPYFKVPTEEEAITMQMLGEEIPLPPRLSTMTNRTDCTFFAIKWGRIILEEGHSIKNMDSQTFKAVRALGADRRMIISGTPLINDYTDLRAFFCFFKLSPFDDADFFLSHFVNVEKNEKTDRPEVGLLQGTRGALLNLALKSVTIRRLKWGKFEGKDITGIPKPDFEPVELTLDNGTKYKIEYEHPRRENHENLLEQVKVMRTYFDWVHNGRKGSPDEVIASTPVKEDYTSFVPQTEQEIQYQSRFFWDEDLCAIFKPPKGKKNRVKAIKTGRGNPARLYGSMGAIHWASPSAKYSLRSEDELISSGAGAELACEATMNGSIDVQKQRRAEFRQRMAEGENVHSTKIDAIFDRIVSRLETTGGKILVFSSFLSCLDILEVLLQKDNIPALRYDGTLNAKDKAEALQRFNDDANIRILILTSEAGGEGLNLQNGVETVILMGPCWTVAQREQVIARAVRLGQKKQVKVYLMHTTNSMDCRVLKVCGLKEDKQNVLLETFSYNGASKRSEDAKNDVERIMQEASNWTFLKFSDEVSNHSEICGEYVLTSEIIIHRSQRPSARLLLPMDQGVAKVSSGKTATMRITRMMGVHWTGS